MLERPLPDIVSESEPEIPAALQWVGMEKIAVPVSVQLPGSDPLLVPASANVYVSLDTPTAKGIHMSRLHRLTSQLATMECNKDVIQQLLNDVVDSQEGVGHRAKLELSFELILSKPALLSEESGYQSYPVKISAEKNQEDFALEIEITIPYSSTCPCSASLSRQLYAESIDERFVESPINKADLLSWVQSQAGTVATPHSQRSYAYIRLSIEHGTWPDLAKLTLDLEDMIGTPVQTAVKRVDEQAFAKLNAENLMFCEDAARRIKFGLERMQFVNDYWFRVEHQESLHAHNAVVIDQKYNITK